MDLSVTKEKFRVEWKVVLLDYEESPTDISGNLENGEIDFIATRFKEKIYIYYK